MDIGQATDEAATAGDDQPFDLGSHEGDGGMISRASLPTEVGAVQTVAGNGEIAVDDNGAEVIPQAQWRDELEEGTAGMRKGNTIKSTGDSGGLDGNDSAAGAEINRNAQADISSSRLPAAVYHADDQGESSSDAAYITRADGKHTHSINISKSGSEHANFDAASGRQFTQTQQVVEAGEGADMIAGVDDLPIFANDQSKALNDEIKRREEKAAIVDESLADNTERIRIMEEHLKNVRQEVGHTNALMAAKKKEIATEEHLCALAAREAGRYAHEARKFVVDAEEAQDKLNAVQNSIFGANESMDRFKLQMNWNQEELEQWALAAKQKEMDNLALQKYTRADDVKIKELSLQVERLSKTVVTRRAELQNLEAESSAKQVELDKTAQAFKQLHEERQDLIRQWQNAIDGMRRRDGEINTAGEKYAAARRVRGQRAEIVAQNTERLKMQRKDNEEVKISIDELERGMQRRRQESQAAQKRMEEFRDELEVVKNTLGNGAGALARKRAENATLTAQIGERRNVLEAARRRYQVSKQQVDTEESNTQKAEATAQGAEEELLQRETELRSAEKNVDTAKAAMFRDSQKLYAFRREEANLIAEICGAQATMKNLQTKIHSLDQDQMRQQEFIYSAEFQIQHMERKVARGMGERTDEEKQVLKAKIRDLEGEVEVVRDEKKMLTAQARKLNNELRASLRRQEAVSLHQAELNETINELELECRAADGDVRREAQTKEELMVSNDVMRLEVKRLRDALNGAADEVFSLENRRQQLAMSMKERKAEIQVHWDLQRATLRAAEEERHKAQMELGQRKQAVETFRAKYETLSKSFVGRVEGKEGGSQAYYIIAAAQKREELQREGDGLDQDIRRCEREIRALESTLRHLNARNVDFRMSFQRADPASSDADALRGLESRVKVAQDAIFRRKKELQRAETDHAEDFASLEGVRTRTARLDERKRQLESTRGDVGEELEAQREALAHAEERLAQHRASHRKTQSETSDPNTHEHAPPAAEAPTGSLASGETLTEKAFRAGSLNDTATGVLYTLGQLAKEFPEMHDTLYSNIRKQRLRIPPAPPAFGPGPATASVRNAASRGSGASGRGHRPGSQHSRGGVSSGSSCSDVSSRRGIGSNGREGSNINPMRMFEAPM